jgi:hypothetical protein
MRFRLVFPLKSAIPPALPTLSLPAPLLLSDRVQMRPASLQDCQSPLKMLVLAHSPAL